MKPDSEFRIENLSFEIIVVVSLTHQGTKLNEDIKLDNGKYSNI